MSEHMSKHMSPHTSKYMSQRTSKHVSVPQAFSNAWSEDMGAMAIDINPCLNACRYTCLSTCLYTCLCADIQRCLREPGAAPERVFPNYGPSSEVSSGLLVLLISLLRTCWWQAWCRLKARMCCCIVFRSQAHSGSIMRCFTGCFAGCSVWLGRSRRVGNRNLGVSEAYH